MIKIIIYKATNLINNKVYIGATQQTLIKRKNEHIRKAKNKKIPNNYFYRALNKYGKKNFKWEIIDNAETYTELMKKEKFWIKHYNSFGENGYNSCEGGGNTKGYKFSEATKQKLSIKAKERFKKETNPFKGKCHSQEQKEQWSRQRKGRELGDTWLLNIRNARKKQCKKVINLDTGQIFNSISEAHSFYGIKKGIDYVCQGKKKTAAGYRWAFYDKTNQDNTVPSQSVD